MRKTIFLLFASFMTLNLFAQKWEKLSPQIIFAEDQNHNPATVKVGIGLQNPSERLHVNGNLRVQGKIFADSMRISKILADNDSAIHLGENSISIDYKNNVISWSPSKIGCGFSGNQIIGKGGLAIANGNSSAGGLNSMVLGSDVFVPCFVPNAFAIGSTVANGTPNSMIIGWNSQTIYADAFRTVIGSNSPIFNESKFEAINNNSGGRYGVVGTVTGSTPALSQYALYGYLGSGLHGQQNIAVNGVVFCDQGATQNIGVRGTVTGAGANSGPVYSQQYGILGDAYGNSSVLAGGIVAYGRDATTNYGGQFFADATNSIFPPPNPAFLTTTTYGVQATAGGAKYNYGGHYKSQASPGMSIQNYGLWAETDNGTVNNIAGFFFIPGGVPSAFNYALSAQAPSGPSNLSAYFNGDVARTGTDNFTSDAMLKENNNSFSGLDLIRQFNPHTFTFKTANFPSLSLPAGIHYGFTAQQVETFLPEFVRTISQPARRDTQGNIISERVDFKTLNYIEIIPITVGAIKELDAAVSALQNTPPSGISGSGTANFLTKWNSSSSIGSSQVFDDGFNVGIDNSNPTEKLTIGNENTAWLNEQVAFSVKDNSGQFVGNGYSLAYLPDGNAPGGSGAKMIIGWGVDANEKSATFDLGDYINIGRQGHDISFTTNGGGDFSERMRITQSGDIGIGTSSPTERLHVIGNILATGTITQNSDAALKQNVDSIQEALNIIAQLKPRTFNFDTTGFPYLNLPSGKQFGLVAQEAETVLPEIVSSSLFPQVNPGSNSTVAGGTPIPETHYKTVNYTALIPILIKAMQEQQDKISQLESTVSGCCSTNAKTVTASIPSTDVELASKSAVLWQNFPNPFGDGTVIRYYVPETTGSATIVFYDEFGNEIKTAELPYKGQKAELNLSTMNLAAGIYSYSLVVNGKIVDTKRMIKSK